MLTNEISGVIFDLDNTLVSSSLNFNQIRESIGCPYETDILDYVEMLPQEEKLLAENMLIEHEMNDALHSKKLVGVIELLDLLTYLAIPCAIVTRNSRKASSLKMKNNHIVIDLLLTREDSKAKPAPDALFYIAAYWSLKPEKILLVGDYLYDLQAAKNANVLSCLVTNGKSVDYGDLANIVVSNLNELKDLISQVFNIPAEVQL
jgi:HAD superfamily hydrolase (TIGR01549 family)